MWHFCPSQPYVPNAAMIARSSPLDKGPAIRQRDPLPDNLGLNP
jgi:hypothetical protein